ncbi:TIGR04149 family rSAM-modified RiPP [Sphingobacterium lumbrici]|uniref:TIGR04149 family rSAM-modified RiPP n=1 Tax=Sphingobacterium lumbrici TaxID=2559600 RepID=UPI00112BCA18|nr:TIGR04149 family rSAM-modified RiPP [Sphingobacterium lumbrici]
MNKKISLKNLNIKEVEQLSRTQLRNVLGGYSGETTVPAICSATCTCPSGYRIIDSNQQSYDVTADCSPCSAIDDVGVVCGNGSNVLCNNDSNCEPIPIST